MSGRLNKLSNEFGKLSAQQEALRISNNEDDGAMPLIPSNSQVIMPPLTANRKE